MAVATWPRPWGTGSWRYRAAVAIAPERHEPVPHGRGHVAAALGPPVAQQRQHGLAVPVGADERQAPVEERVHGLAVRQQRHGLLIAQRVLRVAASHCCLASSNASRLSYTTRPLWSGSQTTRSAVLPSGRVIRRMTYQRWALISTWLHSTTSTIAVLPVLAVEALAGPGVDLPEREPHVVFQVERQDGAAVAGLQGAAHQLLGDWQVIAEDDLDAADAGGGDYLAGVVVGGDLLAVDDRQDDVEAVGLVDEHADHGSDAVRVALRQRAGDTRTAHAGLLRLGSGVPRPRRTSAGPGPRQAPGAGA